MVKYTLTHCREMGGFYIDIGKPIHRCIKGAFEDDLSDAIQAAFPMETEDAHIIWCGTPVALSYKYDVSVIMEDVICMLEQCSKENAGCIQVNFGSSTFNANWKLRIEVDSVLVTAQWNSVANNCEDSLNMNPSILVGRKFFLDQWFHLLRCAIDGVQAAGIRLADDSLLVRARLLMHGRTA